MKLTPFKRWTIENFPFIEADFDAITNYQLYCKIVEYLNKVIASQNATIEQVEAMQEYLDSLDIQELVDNKLDEMAESGQLTDIIAQYLDLAGVLAYNTISDLSNAENVTAGSICYTLGQTTYNDGKGAFYKVRNVTTGDVIDGFNIVAIVNDNTVIAERLPNYYINDINNRIDLMNSKKTLIIGDSFIAEYPNNNWGLKLKALLNLADSDITILGEGGAGIYNVGNQDTNFLGLLQANIGNITNKDLYTRIIIGGGYNDGNATSTTDILSNMESLITYCKTQFPNAKIYLSCFGWNMKYDGILFRQRINEIVIPCYKQASKYGAYYLENTEFCYRDVTLYDGSDPVTEAMVHPNDNGQKEIAQAIYNALTCGYMPRYKSSNIPFNATTSSDITSANMYFTHVVTPFNHVLNLNGNFNLAKTYNPNNGLSIDLGLIDDPYIRRTSDNYGTMCSVIGRVYSTASKVYYVNIQLSYNSAGHVLAGIPRGLSQESFDISSLVIVDTATFDRYIW